MAAFAAWVRMKLFVARSVAVTTRFAVRASIPVLVFTDTFISVASFFTPPVGKSVHQSAVVAIFQSESDFILIIIS